MQEYKTLKDLTKILSLFNDFQAAEKGVSEIANALEMSPSKISRMLSTLECEGFFEKNSETGKYSLGVEFFNLGVVFAFHLPLRKILRPHIEQMAKELNLTTSWAIIKNSKVLVIDRIQNLNIDMLVHRIGLNIPVHTTSVGKVLLADLSEEEQDKILQSVSLIRFTEASIVDKKLIKEHLKLVKERGYAVDNGETNEGVNCLAVPIRNSRGEVIAAINLTDEASRTNMEKLLQHTDYLKEKALFVSRQLGYRVNIL